MGFLDSLTNAFTGNPAKEAAAQTQQYLAGVGATNNNTINSAVGTANNAVTSGAAGARDAYGNAYTTGVGNVNDSSANAQDYLAQGFGDARSAYDPLKALSGKYGGATTLALNSLGVNGADGTAAARAAFTNSPAYEFNLDQGIDAINRRRNMGGMLASGNADRDAQTFGAGLASNQYDTWMNNLLGFTNPELQATSGAATGIAGVDTGLATNQANVASDRGKMLADLASKYGSSVAGVDTGQGQSLANIAQSGAGQSVASSNALAQPYANTYGQVAAAEQQGSANLWNLAGNVGKLAVGGVGKLAA